MAFDPSPTAAAGERATVVHNSWLDVLRGLAALAVTLYHLNETVPGPATVPRAVAGYGWLGVPVFFVLSGYVVHTAATRTATVRLFAWRRLTRILPPYWASLAVVAAVVGLQQLTTGENDLPPLPRGIGGWAATLTAMVAPASETMGLNWVYWTLPYEIAFYAVTLAALVRPRWFPHLAVALALLTVVFSHPSGSYRTPGPFGTIPTFPGFFWLSHWPIYALGVGLSLRDQGRRTAAAAVLVASLGATALCFPPSVTITATASVLCIVASRLRPLLSPGRGAFAWLGRISYSLYLIHVPIGCWLFLQWKTGVWAESAWGSAAYDAAAAGLCVLAAWVFHLLVERPSMTLGRRPPWRTARGPGQN